MSLKVGIVGLGTAGTAAAVFLARQGHQVTIAEKISESLSRTQAGAGIGIQPIGLTVLRRLGILDSILDHGHRIDRLLAKNERGRTVLDLAYGDIHPDLFGVGLHRDVLFTELVAAARAEPGVSVQFDFPVEGLTSAGVDGSKENWLEGPDGRREGPFDLLIVADGRQSVGRTMSGVKAYESWYPFGCFWAILPDVEREFTQHAELSQVLSAYSPTEMLGMLPSGRAHGMAADDPALVSLFWSVDMRQVDGVKAAGITRWKDRVLELQPRAAGLLRQIQSFDDLIVAQYSDVFMPRLYHGASTVFMGDCAHATSPQLGQGANLALVDAWALSVSLLKTNGDPHAAVRHFNSSRRWRLWFYQMNSRLLTPVFQSHSRTVGLLRDLTMGPMCSFGPTRRQMLTTMIGAQNNGWPWSTIPKGEFMGFCHPDLL